jgi:hypothetical protein
VIAWEYGPIALGAPSVAMVFILRRLSAID